MLEHPWVRRHAVAAATSTCSRDVVRPREVLTSATNMTAQHTAHAGVQATVTIKTSVTTKVRFDLRCSNLIVLRAFHCALRCWGSV